MGASVPDAHFYGSDRVVSFDPVGAEDDAAAMQESDVANYLVTKANRGDSFEAIYSFVKDALMQPTAYAKVYVEKEERSYMRTANGLTEGQLAELDAMENVEITERGSETIQVPVQTTDQNGQPVEAMQDVVLHDVKYRETDDRPKIRIIPVPGEEALIDHNHTSLNLDGARFVAHRVRKYKSELLMDDEWDVTEDDLMSVMSYGEESEFNDERTHRLFYEDENPDGNEGDDDKADPPFWCHEIVMWVDYDEDGTAEYRKIKMIGHEIFGNEECDYQPMIAMSSIIMPHKHNGMALAEMVEDQQQLLTTLHRNMLDNVYRTARDRKYISEDGLIDDGSTMDAILDPTSEYVPVRGPNASAVVMPEQQKSIVGEVLPVIQHTQSRSAMRTGVAPENSVDDQVLNSAKTGAFLSALDKASERIELIARVMAETGLKQLFRKIHVLARTYPDVARTVRLRGQWVPIDPSSWRERTDMTANIGLGTGNRQEQIAFLQAMLETQIRPEVQGLGIVKPEHVYHTVSKLAEAGDAGAAEQFFISPAAPDYQPPQPPSPDPVAVAQAELFRSQAQAVVMDQQNKAQKTQQDGQIALSKLQVDSEGKRLDNQAKMAELTHKGQELELKRAEMTAKTAQEQAKVGETEAREENLDASSDLMEAQRVKALADAEKSVAEPT